MPFARTAGRGNNTVVTRIDVGPDAGIYFSTVHPTTIAFADQENEIAKVAAPLVAGDALFDPATAGEGNLHKLRFGYS